jgi:hypothetical protein
MDMSRAASSMETARERTCLGGFPDNSLVGGVGGNEYAGQRVPDGAGKKFPVKFPDNSLFMRITGNHQGIAIWASGQLV